MEVLLAPEYSGTMDGSGAGVSWSGGCMIHKLFLALPRQGRQP